MQNKKAFSFIEIIISISIIVLLTVIGISYKQWYDENVANTTVVANIETINNALSSYSAEKSDLPMPGWNTNYFAIDTTYNHSYEDSSTFWVYGSITENTIPKKYLDVLPLDPRTNSYYSYGKTKATNQFEIASVQVIDYKPSSRVVWNYRAESWPFNLIREYNWSSFVYNNSETNFPYNPDELILIATDSEWNVYREWDTIITWVWEEFELFFSDGSVSVLEENSELTLNKLNFKNDDNLNTIIKLGLWAGSLWTKATQLNDESEFEVYTTDSSAAVRWTIFWVSKLVSDTETIVLEWEVDIYKNQIITDTTSEDINELVKINSIFYKKDTIVHGDWDLKVLKWENPKILNWFDTTINFHPITDTTEIDDINDNLINNFTESEDYKIVEWTEEITINTKIETNEIDNIFTNTSCTTFEIEWTCQDSENNLAWWNLVAYAPFEQEKDLNLYWAGWFFAESYNNYVSGERVWWWKYKKYDWWADANYNWDNLSSFGTELDRYSSFVKANTWEKGIVLTPLLNSDYLKYTDLNLTWDFVIEIRVKFPSTIPTTTRYLFELGDYKSYLTPNTNPLIFLKNWAGTNSNISTYYDWNFHTITAKKESNNYSLEIDWNSMWLSFTSIFPIWTELYIWWKSSNTSQINNIIDYIKIYKK